MHGRAIGAMEPFQNMDDVFDSLPVPCYEIGMEGRIVRVNRAQSVLLGYEASAVAGKPIWDMVSPELREVCESDVRKKLTGD